VNYLNFLVVFVMLIVIRTAVCANDLVTKVDAYMNAQVKTGRYNGSVLIAKNNQILVKKGYGVYDIALDVSARPDHKYELGSIAKTFTALSIMLLYEDGKITFSDPLSKFLPGFPNGKNITIHHLLTHTSGLHDYDNRLVFQSLDEIIDSFKNEKVEFQPGERAMYCSAGYYLLRKIVEITSGMDHQKFVEENIFKKLNMTSSGFVRDREIIPNLGKGYFNGSDGLIYPSYSEKEEQGSLYSNIGDLYLLNQALYSERLLSED